MPDFKFIQETASYQRHLLLKAVQLLAVGGRLVYSTCSISREENEDNVSWILLECPRLRLLERSQTGIMHGQPGIGFKMEWSIHRFEPWDEYDTIGFFIACFQLF